MLRREQFPLDYVNSEGKLMPKPVISSIPFLHPHFIANQFDLSLINEDLVEEIEQNTNLDKEQYRTRPYLKYEKNPTRLGRMEIGDNYIKFPNFKEGLCIEPTRITPFDPSLENGGIYIYPRSPVVYYEVSAKFPFSDELIREYKMTKALHEGVEYVRIKRGWHSHNLDTRDILFTNVIMSLNNAFVRRKSLEK